MKRMGGMLMRKFRNDIILIGAILLISITSIIIMFSCSNNDNLKALVYFNNEIVLEIDLDVDDEYIVKGKISDIKILVSNKKLSVIESECSDRVCINQGSISKANQTITCLPNEIYIKLVGTKSEVDVIV